MSTPEIPGSLRLTGKQAAKNRCTAAFALGVPAAATVAAIVLLCLGIIHFTAKDLVISAAMYSITGLGVTVGMHRLFSHRSFEAGSAVQAVLAACGIMALQGNVTGWVATHRRHHRFSDEQGDPHSPIEHHKGKLGALRALFFVHVSRLFMAEDTCTAVYASDLRRNRVIQQMDRLALLWIFLTLAIPAAAGWCLEGGIRGVLSGLLWGGLVRIFVGQNVGSAVNSVCHMFGKTHFKTTDVSKNNLWVALAAFGEGWHNNHHAFPCSAKQGLFRWQLDPSYALIALLEYSGLVWNVKVPTAEMVAKRRLTPATSGA
jgi:stearoyl-CoA desaturase (delta-9 desaturase)